MKIIIQLLCILLPLSIAHAEFDVPHVVVFGLAEKEVVPDELRWALSVKTLGGVVAEVSEKHAADVSSILSYLKDSGLSDKDVKTSGMQLRENMVYRDNSRFREGYFGFTQITFLLSDTARYLEYWQGLSSFENLTISSVSFTVSNRKVIQDDTRIVAVKNAREKAVALASAVGSEVLKPLLIEEIDSSSPGPRNVMRSMEMSDSGNAGGVSPGYETVQARVRVLFEID